ncbi:hypothetical protein ORV05_34570 [Amycolatopsis cynarae]|uniref:Uncharacterized protein n=1 Tax=Amycolatopsis cynarae TaxID=2995223 RepID=A0ABY7B3W7_9PSEU|nr:hypothetical protein [Amycolatopsis sp. HUAS 11-8]WAL65923.1 hypothetical protein ORV05_34570 [Amycolatopsis sp. HUAS 11-8]
MATPTDNPTRRRWPGAMLLGLALTVVATVAPLVDVATVDTVADHVRAAYPDWGPDLVKADRNAIVIYLVIIGVLGILCWLPMIWAVVTRKRWARGAATTVFAVGACLSLAHLTMGGGAYKVILPVGYGILTLLPSIAGLAAVVSLWRGRPAKY